MDCFSRFQYHEFHHFFLQNLPIGFDNKLLEDVFWSLNFQILLSQILAVYAICNFNDFFHRA